MLNRRNTRRLLPGIYIAALVYFVLKLVYYALYVGSFPDEGSHISYVIAMARSPALIPDYAHMARYITAGSEGGLSLVKPIEGAVNYLGHPPLYYILMSLFGGISFRPDGLAAVDVLRLRLANIVLSSAAAAIAFFIGGRRLKDRSPAVHALYAFAIATLPELGYVSAAVSNDNLAFFAFVLFFAGLLRYDEGKADFRAYALIGAGFFLGSFSKLTTALIMLIILAAVLIISVVRTRSLRLVTSRYFLLTLPSLLLFLAYELMVHRKYGSWQPSLSLVAPEYFLKTNFYVAPENRVPMTFLQYLRHFAGSIGYSWSSLYGHRQEVTNLMNNRLYGLVFWVPVALAFLGTVLQYVKPGKGERAEERPDSYSFPVMLAFLGTLAYHCLSGWKGFLQSGYTGGAQARYYLFLIVPFALTMCERIPPLFRTRTAKRAGAALALALIALWLAGDAPRLLLTMGLQA